MQIVAREAETQEGLPEERLLRLQHLIASHQGKPEWDSPCVPQLVEVLILHYADDLDAKLNQASALLRGVAPGEWSAYDRSLARSILQPASPPGTRGAMRILRSTPQNVRPTFSVAEAALFASDVDSEVAGNAARRACRPDRKLAGRARASA